MACNDLSKAKYLDFYSHLKCKIYKLDENTDDINVAYTPFEAYLENREDEKKNSSCALLTSNWLKTWMQIDLIIWDLQSKLFYPIRKAVKNIINNINKPIKEFATFYWLPKKLKKNETVERSLQNRIAIFWSRDTY